MSMEFSRQEYWSKLPVASPGDSLDLGIQPGSPELHTYSLPSELLGKPRLYLSSPLSNEYPCVSEDLQCSYQHNDDGDDNIRNKKKSAKKLQILSHDNNQL